MALPLSNLWCRVIQQLSEQPAHLLGLWPPPSPQTSPEARPQTPWRRSVTSGTQLEPERCVKCWWWPLRAWLRSSPPHPVPLLGASHWLLLGGSGWRSGRAFLQGQTEFIHSFAHNAPLRQFKFILIRPTAPKGNFFLSSNYICQKMTIN